MNTVSGGNRVWQWSLGLALGCLAACSRVDPLDNAQQSSVLMRNLLRGRSVEVQSHVAPLEAGLARTLERFPPAQLSWTQASLPAHAARVVIGTPSEPAIRALAEVLGIVVHEHGFVVAGQAFAAPADAMVAVFPDPERAGLPLTLYLANDPQRLAAWVSEGIAPGWRSSIRIWRGPFLEWEGALDAQGRVDAARLVRVPTPRLQAAPDLSSAHAAWERARAWAPLSAQPGELLVFEELAEFTRQVGGSAPAQLDARTLSTLAYRDSFLPNAGNAELVLAGLRAALGPCAEPWLEQGAAHAAAGEWWGVELAPWWQHLERGAVPTRAQLCERDAERRWSAHVLVPWRARLFQELLAEKGAAFVQAVWRGQQTWQAPATSFARTAANPATRRSLATPLRGVSVVAAIDPSSCDAAQALGTNALGVRVAFQERASLAPLPDPRRGPSLQTLSGDLSLYLSLRQAQARGWVSWVEPELWSEGSSGLSGNHPRTSPETWQAFFDQLQLRLEHVALLSELAQAQLLSLGSDLAPVSVAKPYGARALPGEERIRREGWEQVLRGVRSRFQGALSFVSGSWLELSSLALHEQVDCLGVRCDPRRVAQAGLSLAEQRAATYQQLLSFLEPVSQLRQSSRPMPWYLARSTSIDPDSIEVLGAALLALPEERRPFGVFFARWPSSSHSVPRSPADPLLLDPAVRAAITKVFARL